MTAPNNYLGLQTNMYNPQSWGSPTSGNPWSPLFGQIGTQYNEGGTRNYGRHIEDLSSNYSSPRNDYYFGDLVSGLIPLDNDWTITKAYPLVQRDELNFVINKQKFQKALIGVVPYQGIPNTMTHSKESLSAQQVQHAVSIFTEVHFSTTAEGVLLYARNVKQIVVSIKETMAHSVLEEL